MLMYIKFWAFSRRSGCQMSKPPQVTQVVYNLWKIVDANIHKCGYSQEGLDVKCSSLLKIVYHLTKWWKLMYIIFGHFPEGLDVKCPNRLMTLLSCVYIMEIVDIDIHKYGYSLEGLDVKCPNFLQILYHLTKQWMLMYTVLDILMKFGFKCQNHIMILKLCISYGNSGN